VYLDDIGALLLALRSVGAALPKGVRLPKGSRKTVSGGPDAPGLTPAPQRD
jgi:hypothetical protein